VIKPIRKRHGPKTMLVRFGGIFQQLSGCGMSRTHKNTKLIIDSFSLFYIMGCTIDYKEGFAGSQIVIENPQATSSCGCGESVGF